MDHTLWGHLVIFVTFLVGTVATWMRQTRQRRWDLEDRKAAREAQAARDRDVSDQLGKIHTTIQNGHA